MIRIIKQGRVLLLIFVVFAGIGVWLYSQSRSSATVINGIVVPPEPNPKVNNATLAGIDLNKNGVRDDVERMIARMYGNNESKFNEAFAFSRLEQAGIINSNKKTAEDYTKAVDCSTMTADELDPITFALLNTSERRQAYGVAYAGNSGGTRNDCAGWEQL